MLPGDELIVECHYNTEDRKDLAFGGIDMDNAMCMVHLVVYPRPEMLTCGSVPNLPTIANASKINGDEVDDLQAAIWQFLGEKTQDTSYWLQDGQSERYQRIMTFGNHDVGCIGRKHGLNVDLDTQYPKFEPYKEPPPSYTCD